MNEYVDRMAYEKLNRDLNHLTVKHRNILQKQILLVSTAASNFLTLALTYTDFYISINRRYLYTYFTRVITVRDIVIILPRNRRERS